MEKILLNANESWANIDKELLQEFQKAVSTVAFHRYPDPESRELREAYSRYSGLPWQQILAGNGSDELLGMLIGWALQPGEILYTLDPDFTMYHFYAKSYRAKVEGFAMKSDCTWDVEEFIARGKEIKPGLILFSNPNNPTGSVISTQDVLRIVEAFPQIPVAVDEAYGEFCGEGVASFIESYENLLVFRTLSKAFGLAALRCGFLMGSTGLIEKLSGAMVPYNVSTMTQGMGVLALEEPEKSLAPCRLIVEERRRMWEEIQQMELKNLRMFPSETNFFFGKGNGKNLLLAKMMQEGIVIRSLEKDSFRITVGSPEDNDVVLRLLKEVG